VPTVRLSVLAEADIERILDWSFERFGSLAAERYRKLIDVALHDLAADPQRPGVRQRDDVGARHRTYHLLHSRDRARTSRGVVGRPRHLLVFRQVDADTIIVLRVLHDSMDIAQHVPTQVQGPFLSEDPFDWDEG
jgi:toxin ParE1/3/4